MPHEHLAIFDDLDLLRQKLQTFTPDVIFNLADQFRNNRAFDQHIVSYPGDARHPVHRLRLDRAHALQAQGISKKILSYHRIHTPHFVIIPRGKRAVRPRT
jgi:D-alanine-D-alanine ligase